MAVYFLPQERIEIMKKVLSLILVLVLIVVAIPITVVSADGVSLGIGVISDIHYYPAELTGDYCPEFLEYCRLNTRHPGQSVALLDSALYALEKHAAEKGIKYLLIPGDLSHDGEYEAHRILAERLLRFEQETGIEVIVTNGNHDIRKYNPITFENGFMEDTRGTEPWEFLELYKDLGYDLAYNTYTPLYGEEAGMLSYSVKLDGNIRLICIDCETYGGSSLNSTYEGENTIPSGLMNWVIAEMEDARNNGERIIGMTHESIPEHFDMQSTVLNSTMADNWLEVSETLADGGMNFIFTGHTHMNDIVTAVSDSGETITDIMTPSLTGFPNTFREVVFTNTGSEFSADVKSFEPDCEKPITYLGTTYEYPYSQTFGFGQSYGHNGLAQYGTDIAYTYLSQLLDGLKDKDISELLYESGIELDGALAAIIGVLADRLLDIYYDNPENLYNIIDRALTSIATMQISELSSTKFIDTLGFGNTERGGNFEEFGQSLVVYLFGGNEYLEDDLFMADALEKAKSGELIDKLLYKICSVLIDDIFSDEIPSMLLPPVISGDKEFLLNMIETLIRDGLAEAGIPFPENLDALKPSAYVGELFVTYASVTGISKTLSLLVEGILTDNNPGFKQDSDAFITYTGPVAVEATTKNERLPFDIKISKDGDDTERTISWLTKYSVLGSDIEILPIDVDFTGTPSGTVISKSTTLATNTYNSVEFLPTLGILPYEITRAEHSLTIAELSPDTVYHLRVGDASKGYWSDEIILDTSSGGGILDFPFFAQILALFNSLMSIIEALKTLIAI